MHIWTSWGHLLSTYVCNSIPLRKQLRIYRDTRNILLGIPGRLIIKEIDIQISFEIRKLGENKVNTYLNLHGQSGFEINECWMPWKMKAAFRGCQCWKFLNLEMYIEFENYNFNELIKYIWKCYLSNYKLCFWSSDHFFWKSAEKDSLELFKHTTQKNMKIYLLFVLQLIL